jgi:hypothetical protein
MPGILDFLTRNNKEDSEGDESFSYAKINNDEILEGNLTEDLLQQQDPDQDRKFELLVQAYLRDTHYQSRQNATYSFIYAIINACFVALPFACYQIGIPLYVLSVLVFGSISGYTATMMIAVANDQDSHPRSLEELMGIAYGPTGFVVAAVLQILLSLTLMVMSVGVFSEITSSILTNQLPHSMFAGVAWLRWLAVSRQGCVIIASAVTLPIILRAATMAHLRWMSYVSILCIVAAFASVVVSWLATDPALFDHNALANATAVSTPKTQWWVFSFICTICFSNSQKNFSVYASLRQRNPTRWKFVVRRAYVVVIMMYLVFGTLGYASHMTSRLHRFNFFLDFDSSSASSSNISLIFDVFRGLVALSVLLLMPGDCLVASTAIRRTLRRAKASLLRDRTASHTTGASGEEGGNNNNNNNSANAAASRAESGGVQCEPIEEESWSRTASTVTANSNTLAQPGTATASAPASGGSGSTPAMMNTPSRNPPPVSNGENRRSIGASSVGTGATDDTEWMTYSYSGRSSMDRDSADFHAVGGDNDNSSSPARPSGSSTHRSDRLSSIYTTDTDNDDNDGKNNDADADADADSDAAKARKLRKQRSSSVGDVHHAIQKKLQNARGVCVCIQPIDPNQAVTMLGVWAGVMGLSFIAEAGVALAATIGSISTATLAFLIPSLVYFRMGLSTDYQARPFLEAFPALGVPNQVYMSCIRVIGAVLLLSNVLIVMWTLVSGPFDFFANGSNGGGTIESQLPS